MNDDDYIGLNPEEQSKLGAYTICDTLSAVNQMVPPCRSGDTTVKVCFNKIALKTHPDRNPNNPDAEKKFKDLNTANGHIKNFEYKNKLCSAIPPPQQKPPPPPLNPYRKAYDETQKSAPPNCTFGDFKAIFISNLLPILLVFCLIVVGLFGNRLKYSNGPTRPPGYENRGYGGKTRGKKSNNRRTSVGGGGAGDAGEEDPEGDIFFPATSEFLGRDMTVDIDVETTGDETFHDAHDYIEGDNPEPRDNEEPEDEDAKADIPGRLPEKKTLRSVRVPSVRSLAAVLGLFCAALIPAVIASNMDTIKYLADDSIALFNTTTHIVADSAQASSLFIPDAYNPGVTMMDPTRYNVGGAVKVTAFKQFCHMKGVPPEQCSTNAIIAKVNEFTELVADLPRFFNHFFSKIVSSANQSSDCTLDGKYEGKKIIKQATKGFMGDTPQEVRDIWSDCAFPPQQAFSVTFDDKNLPILNINSSKLVHNMNMAGKILEATMKDLGLKNGCPNVQLIVPLLQQQSNQLRFVQEIFKTFDAKSLSNVSPASIANQCLISGVLKEMFTKVIPMLRDTPKNTDIAHIVYTDSFAMLKSAMTSERFLFLSETERNVFDSQVREALVNQMWSSIVVKGARDAGGVAAEVAIAPLLGFADVILDSNQGGRVALATGALGVFTMGIAFVINFFLRNAVPGGSVVLPRLELPSIGNRGRQYPPALPPPNQQQQQQQQQLIIGEAQLQAQLQAPLAIMNGPRVAVPAAGSVDPAVGSVNPAVGPPAVGPPAVPGGRSRKRSAPKRTRRNGKQPSKKLKRKSRRYVRRRQSTRRKN